jgi:hypothetical protein
MTVVKKTSVLVTMFLMLVAGSARAANQMYVKVPFPFLVDGQLMPAGPYNVSNLASGYVSLHEVGTSPAAIITSTVGIGSENPAGDVPALVFLPYENSYMLIQVWLSREAGFAPYASVPYAKKLQAAEKKLALKTITAQ